MNAISLKLRLNHRSGCLEFPGEVEVVGQAQWEEDWDCYLPQVLVGEGGRRGRRDAICHLSFTGAGGGAGNTDPGIH